MPATETAETSKSVAPKKDKLAQLLAKEEALKRQIAALKARDQKEERKRDTRAKIIVGGAILAHMQRDPETRGRIVEILKKAVTADRDRELLASRGIL